MDILSFITGAFQLWYTEKIVFSQPMISVCGKQWERVSPIWVMHTSSCNSHFEHWNASFSESKLDGVDLISNCRDSGVKKDRGKILWFLADCTWRNYVILLGLLW